MTEAKPVVLGRISGLSGVKGWLKVHSYTEPREAILAYDSWLVEADGTWQPVTLLEGRRHGKTLIACLDGIVDREEAAAFVNRRVGVRREDLPLPDEGEYYWSDLEGLRVVHRDGSVLGTVAYLLETGANDVLVVQGDREILIPFVIGEVIEDVDLAAGLIRVDWEWD